MRKMKVWQLRLSFERGTTMTNLLKTIAGKLSKNGVKFERRGKSRARITSFNATHDADGSMLFDQMVTENYGTQNRNDKKRDYIRIAVSKDGTGWTRLRATREVRRGLKIVSFLVVNGISSYAEYIAVVKTDWKPSYKAGYDLNYLCQTCMGQVLKVEGWSFYHARTANAVRLNVSKVFALAKVR